MSTDLDSILRDIPCLSDLRWDLLAELSSKPHARHRFDWIERRIFESQRDDEAETTLYFYSYVTACRNARLH